MNTDFDFIKTECESEYHARSKSGECISSHLLAVFARSPFKYMKMVTEGIGMDDRPEFAFGRAAHKFILEGRDAFDGSYAVSNGPVNEKTGQPYGKGTKAYAEWLAAQKREIISTDDFEKISAMGRACLGNASVAELFVGSGVAEGVVRAEICGELCQIRMDWFSPETGIVDLKTCRDIEFFEKDCRDFGYAYQLAFYQEVLRVASGVRYPVHIVAVDKTDFNIAGRWDIPDDELDRCIKVNNASIRRLHNIKTSGEAWPTGFENTRHFRLEKEQ